MKVSNEKEKEKNEDNLQTGDLKPSEGRLKVKMKNESQTLGLESPIGDSRQKRLK